ncbi:MAG: hypothetical protein JOZ90_03520 [Alphaproteobacteria bacterium]|nr:hypothetical protein [Alphaproteobacteria bacterium]MBV9372641.1 hypothetical protein [Alphaproteobacteria bacterium]MBV9900148.1 hypothetical protein [Alphaproteobacteria bacterium]
MQTATARPNRRPKLFLPVFLTASNAGRASAGEPGFPLSPDQLGRTVAEMIG